MEFRRFTVKEHDGQKREWKEFDLDSVLRILNTHFPSFDRGSFCIYLLPENKHLLAEDVTADFKLEKFTGWLYSPLNSEYQSFEPKKWLKPESEVSHPSHYNQGKIEVIEYIEDQFNTVHFHLGNAIKYISRAGKKDPNKTIQDLEKAAWYLKRAIEIHNSTAEGRKAIRPNDMNPRPGYIVGKNEGLDCEKR